MFEKEIEEKEEVTVLGKTFSSDEKRRKFFREELRKKLPDLKKMEGFPVGEDDDIINLSDPPFYTACPNPWLNDFIEEWEVERRRMEKKGLRKKDFNIAEPYAADVSEGKTNPIYMAHSYHTKVPHPAIMRYILHYTQPGDLILDGFAGTGMTGVATSFCEKPPIEDSNKFNNAKNSISWGTRFSICGDLSPIASFISYNYNSTKNAKEIEDNCTKLLTIVHNKYGHLYKTKHVNGDTGVIIRTIWSDIFTCPECEEEIVFWNNAVNSDRRSVKSEFPCPSCSVSVNKRSLNKVFETRYDSILNTTVKTKKEVAVLIYYKYKNKSYVKKPDSEDLARIDEAYNLLDKNSLPFEEIINGDKTTEFFRNGYNNYHQLYYPKTLLILSEYFSLAKTQYELFYLTSIILRASKLFRWSKNQAGPMMGTFYIASATFEINPFNLFKNKKRIFDALNLTKNFRSIVRTGSATDFRLESNSVDYIFTDPPFGHNLMYSELNSIWESWLKVFTNNKEEAIENRAQSKSILDYQLLMERAFKEYYRVLKPGKWITVEFSNTSAAIWNTIQLGLNNSGFIIANVSALDKKQGTFNAVSNPTSVKQDLVISCYKPSVSFDNSFKKQKESVRGIYNFVEEHLNHLPIHLSTGQNTTAIIERSPKILFDRLVAFYIQNDIPVPIDATEFRLGIRDRFIERDGMFFTNEQVHQYDKKKREFPDVVQLSILVSSEQDGVFWLKDLLKNKPLAYNDIQPLWMQALAGARKGDVLPELAIILEENFLKDETGKWYLPNPENEADLEKLRNKRLLKQFAIYNEVAIKPKGKIKECRVDALRAGFKQCYQDKDFKTIVLVGDRIPNNLLMEDEVLLQFYDIASSRV